MLIVTGHITVKPSDLSQFCMDLETLATATRQREGNLSYDAAVADASAARLLVAEKWTDQAALSAHLAAADTMNFVRKWQGRMQGDIRKYDASNERSLTEA